MTSFHTSGSYIVVYNNQDCLQWYMQDIINKIFKKNILYCDALFQGIVIECKPSGINGYKKNDFDLMRSMISLTQDNSLLIYIYEADLLGEILSNTLLKVLEQLPTNIFIFFITKTKEVLLPTLISRSITLYAETSNKDKNNNFINFIFDPSTTLHSLNQYLLAHDINSLDSYNYLINILTLCIKKKYDNDITSKIQYIINNYSNFHNKNNLWKSVYGLLVNYRV
jgi:DNA polymerase III delta prime subunit